MECGARMEFAAAGGGGWALPVSERLCGLKWGQEPSRRGRTYLLKYEYITSSPHRPHHS